MEFENICQGPTGGISRTSSSAVFLKAETPIKQQNPAGCCVWNKHSFKIIGLVSVVLIILMAASTLMSRSAEISKEEPEVGSTDHVAHLPTTTSQITRKYRFVNPLEPYVGNWRLGTQDNINEFYKAIGMGFATRWLASTITPEMYITLDGTSKLTVKFWAITTQTSTIHFNEEHESTTIDGRTAKVLHTMEGSKWISKERWIYGGKEKTAKYVREVTNDQITVNMYVDDVVSVQRYARIR